MLSLTQIINQYPENLKNRKRDILREYLQYQVLNIIFNSKFSKKVAFLGGTALRIIHNNQRFSEDLDFDNLSLSQKDCQDLSGLIKNQLELRGFLVEVNIVSHQAYRLKLRLPKLLHNLKLSPFANEKVLIYIDFAAQNFDYIPEKITINKFDCQATLNFVPNDILLSQKFYTTFNRKRIMGRDFFDIVFLHSLSVKPNFDYLKQKLSLENPEKLKEYMLEKLKDVNLSELVSDIKPFLFFPEDVRKITGFREFVKDVL